MKWKDLEDREQNALLILIVFLFFAAIFWIGKDYRPLADKITDQIEERKESED